MAHATHPLFRKSLTAAACAAVVLLAACGGGGGDDDDTPPAASVETVEGQLADATTMPVIAVDGLDAAVDAFEAALRAEPGGSGSVACAAGGSLDWTATPAGGAADGRLDAGESAAVVYDDCALADGTTLDGSLTVAVTARSADGSDLHLRAGTLAIAKAGGRVVAGGVLRLEREAVATAGGGTRREHEFTGSDPAGLRLETTFGGRAAIYAMRDIDWTVETVVAAGAPAVRTHDGELTLDVDTADRRPDDRLAIDTDGALTLGTDGRVAAGRVAVTATAYAIDATWSGADVRVRVDDDRDGDDDREWSVTRQALQARAG